MHEMHEMQPIVADVHAVYLSVCLSVSVCVVIQCSLCQITLASCLLMI